MSDRNHFDELVADFGKRLRDAREARGWSMDRLAIESRVTKSGIAALEVGRNQAPRASTLRKLATALNLTPEELLYGMTPANAMEIIGLPRMLKDLTDLNQEGIDQAVTLIHLLELSPEYRKNE